LSKYQRKDGNMFEERYVALTIFLMTLALFLKFTVETIG